MASLTALFGLIGCLVAALLVVGVAGFVALVKTGVIVRHITKPALQDHGSYSLNQGREVRPEAETQEERR